MIVITLEGGLVQGVSSDDPNLVGHAVVVIDYDTEEADPDEIVHVPQTEDANDTEEAVLSHHDIGVLYKPVERFLKEV